MNDNEGKKKFAQLPNPDKSANIAQRTSLLQAKKFFCIGSRNEQKL
jgi:hypothetical protein